MKIKQVEGLDGALGEKLRMIDDFVDDVAENDIVVFAGDETRQTKSSGKRIDDSAAASNNIIWTSAKFGNSATKNVGTTSGTVAAGDDSRFYSSTGVPNDGTVTHVKLHTSLKSRAAISASEIDWSAGAIFTKTLSSATTFTFVNIAINKVITLIISGNYTLTLPTGCKRISGSYDGSKTNYISIHCTNDSEGNEEFWYTISQQAT